MLIKKVVERGGGGGGGTAEHTRLRARALSANQLSFITSTRDGLVATFLIRDCYLIISRLSTSMVRKYKKKSDKNAWTDQQMQLAINNIL